MPREVPLTSSMTPLRASACKVFLGGIGRLEPSSLAISGARWRRSGASDGALDQVQDLLLAGCKLHGELHMWFLAALAIYPVPVFLTSFWKLTSHGQFPFAQVASRGGSGHRGTIAGRAANSDDNIGYTAGQGGVSDLLGGIEAPEGVTLVAEQVAQVDSKDMSFDIWQKLALRCVHWLAQSDVVGLVVTHGTDTLEETAFFLPFGACTGQARGADLRDASRHCAGTRRATEPARCDGGGGRGWRSRRDGGLRRHDPQWRRHSEGCTPTGWMPSRRAMQGRSAMWKKGPCAASGHGRRGRRRRPRKSWS
jgi:hypothetical protein